jgi:hypothetical protein
MLDKLTSKSEIPEQAYQYLLSLKAQKLSDSAVKQQLMSKGLTEKAVDTLLKQYYQAHSAALRRAGLIDLVVGAVVCAAGIGFTALTFQLAEGMGATRFVVAWGAILFGAAQVLRGIVRLFRGIWNWQ